MSYLDTALGAYPPSTVDIKTSNPTPDSWYRPRSGIRPADVARVAYVERGLCQSIQRGLYWLNAHPYNAHVRRARTGYEPYTSESAGNLAKNGGMQFEPKYSATNPLAPHGSGTSYPAIYIPPAEDPKPYDPGKPIILVPAIDPKLPVEPLPIIIENQGCDPLEKDFKAALASNKITQAQAIWDQAAALPCGWVNKVPRPGDPIPVPGSDLMQKTCSDGTVLQWRPSAGQAEPICPAAPMPKIVKQLSKTCTDGTVKTWNEGQAEPACPNPADPGKPNPPTYIEAKMMPTWAAWLIAAGLIVGAVVMRKKRKGKKTNRRSPTTKTTKVVYIRNRKKR